MAIVEVEDETMPKKFMEDDPTIKSGIGFAYDVYPIRVGFVRKLTK